MAQGRGTYRAVLADPDALADVSEVQAWWDGTSGSGTTTSGWNGRSSTTCPRRSSMS
ncbi:hypothetical protein ACFPM3_18015 [Streptomyces coeruleoprunus]|uniref:Uncharacterized protein n=1 Tax=Streptomyces coeruleoprunus TaxID=285563 RepID=A0ABV9XF29_9ACTN